MGLNIMGKLTEWEVVRNIVAFLWMTALIFPCVALDGGAVVSIILLIIFVIPTFLYFFSLYRKYKKTSFKSFDAYFASIQLKN